MLRRFRVALFLQALVEATAADVVGVQQFVRAVAQRFAEEFGVDLGDERGLVRLALFPR